MAVFVDGCYWYACPEHMAPNAAWWAEKLAVNVARGQCNDARLIEIGWERVHVWEHEDSEVAAEYLAAQWHADDATVSGSSGAH